MPQSKGVESEATTYSGTLLPEVEAPSHLLRADLVIHIRKIIARLGITQPKQQLRLGFRSPA